MEYGHGGFQANGGGRVVGFEEEAEGRECEGTHDFEVVTQGENVVGAGFVDGGLEGGLAFESIVDGGAVYAGGLRGCGDGDALAQRENNLRLNRRECRRWRGLLRR